MSFCNVEDEDSIDEPIVFRVPAIYSDKVKIHDWQVKTLSEPRDNTDIFPPKGNLHKSSYRRLGPEDEGTGISETRAMLSQIEMKDEYKPITYPRRSLLTMQSLACAEKDYEEKELKLTDILLDPMAICQLDYRTSTSRDYRSPYPPKPKPPPSPPPPEPWLLNRRTIGYSPQDLENRCGYHMFLDDDMDLHQRIAELKMRRDLPRLFLVFICDLKMTEDKETTGQKGLSEWWSEETEYVLQKIERWATFVRGYNRLRSQRWSREASSDEATQFYRLKRSKWKSRPEETKINCCGTFNYQSNSKLENNCLETYSYDHSIYFKTIGDIRSDKRDIIRDVDQDRVSISSEELVEWDASSLVDQIADKPISEKNNNPDVSDAVAQETRAVQNAWPIVDLSKLDLNLMGNQTRDERLPVDRDNYGRDEQENNNRPTEEEGNKGDRENKSRNGETMRNFPSFRKTRQSSTRRSLIVDENNIVRPNVFLNYNNNFDVGISLQD
ncbi:uncharacterized protein LOC114934235 [Nylanderia fulva]|uniref:uncharacterized protein LOC114934235 n=1 Tax=Nylanderia fulva TaxID=613905 RepID=UPI0010FB6107|nr:uncharacterized protein LOC114934235 [Nylanderia fulva]